MSFALWYLDDGALTTAGHGNYRTVLATNRYTEEEVKFLAELLQRRYGIYAHVTKWGTGYVLRMFEEESKKLLQVVNAALPVKLACMQYKLVMIKKEEK